MQICLESQRFLSTNASLAVFKRASSMVLPYALRRLRTVRIEVFGSSKSFKTVALRPNVGCFWVRLNRPASLILTNGNQFEMAGQGLVGCLAADS
jgi:hypothetical protein